MLRRRLDTASRSYLVVSKVVWAAYKLGAVRDEPSCGICFARLAQSRGFMVGGVMFGIRIIWSLACEIAGLGVVQV